MIVDLRIYEIKPYHVKGFVDTYRKYAWPLQLKHLGNCIGWFVGIEGRMNQVVHLWAYESLADREMRRAAMLADPEWQAYLERASEMGLMVRAENHIITPTDFSPNP